MKKLLVSVLLGLIGLGLSAQESESAKTGWSFVPFPDVSYNSDLGLNLGAFSDFFYYGDGSVYPNFLHHIAVAGAWATKGSWYLHGMFDSPSLIPGARVTGSLTWRDCSANNFYGFNGIASPFDATMDMNQETRTAYYTYHRQLLRASALFQTARVAKPNALAGLVFRHIGISDFSLEKYDSDRTLYRAYQAAGLIRSDEAAGGSSLELKLGGSWDTRDVELVPNKGFYAEAYLNGNLDLSHGKYHYAQLVLHWRHFVPIVFKRLTFAYHLGLQQKFVGNMPFYMLPEIATLYYQYEENEGMGSRYTARGFLYNRMLGEGYAWANLELRATVVKFDLWNQHVAFVLMPFMDLASITTPFREDEQKALPGLWQDIKLPVAASAGLGVKLHVNTNFILSVDVGQGFHQQLSNLTVGMASTYMF